MLGRAVDVPITEWGLQSYLELLGAGGFTFEYYRARLRPDVLLFRDYPNSPNFRNDKFWGPAQGIDQGFKMKWHQVGPGRVQLRLPVAMLETAVLAEAHVKADPKHERRQLARFKTHMQLIRENRHIERGRFT